MKYLLQCALLSIMVLASNPMRTCGAGHNKKYVSKTVIDTLIQQAFVNLNATIDGMPGSDFRHLQAVSEAKKTAAKLRAAAQGDPNERYILWKTGELESQILLEERDLLLQQLDKRQKEKNAIIAIFNRELGKKRPEFAVLKKSIDNMKVIDPAKTGEMQRSFDQRDVNISREIVYKLEKALQAGDPVKMQGEFDYCKKNRQYLTIAQSVYNRLETRIQAQSEAIMQKPVIDEQLALVENLLPQNKFGEIWTCLADAQARLFRIETDLPPKIRETYASTLKKYTDMSNRKEDSLVAISYSICAKIGENAALDYMEHILKPMKISETKIGETTMSILRIAALRKKTEDTVLSAEMKALSRQQGGGVDFSQVRDAAKKKAQERADSVRSFEEEKNRLFYRDQARDDSVRQAAQHQAQQELRANQEKAHDVTAQIYAMLDENKINDAYKKFLSVQKPLEKYLAKDAFDLLKSTVLREYLTMAVENTGSSGFTDLPGENQSSANANPQTSADMRRNQEKAQQVISQIYGLLDAKDVDAAHRRFCEVRAPLEKYLCREAFTMLETSVLQAYESVRGRMMK